MKAKVYTMATGDGRATFMLTFCSDLPDGTGEFMRVQPECIYTNTDDAHSAARRVAKQLNLEVEE